MNQLPAPYTPLESLFLFQSLVTHGIEPSAFARVSDLLTNNALIKGDSAYDPTRLKPDALQELFLLLLREEVKSEAEADTSTSPESRKRKIGSPPLPSLKEASEHATKMPALVDRLYARYRDNVVKEIREDERQFARVQKEIQLLERSEKERLAKAAASQNGAPALTQRSGTQSPLPGGVKRGQPQGTQGFPPRPILSPKTTSGTGSVLQPPPGMPRQGSAGGSNEATPSPSSATTPTPTGGLKWEKPLESGNGPIPGHVQPGATATPGQLPVHAPARPIPGKAGLVPPQNAEQLPTPAGSAAAQPPSGRPVSTIPVAPPTRPIPQQTQQAGRPIPGGAQKLAPAQVPSEKRTTTTGPAPVGSAQKDKPHPTFSTHPLKPAIPEHIIRQAAAAAAAATPGRKHASPGTAGPTTPGSTTPVALKRGFGTKWASLSTPSTPGPIAAEPESPAYEPVSPPPRAASILSDTSRAGRKDTGKQGIKTESHTARPRGRPPRNAQRGRGTSDTPSLGGTRRSQSVASQPDELSMDHPSTATKIKTEALTPRHIDETGDTTADESVHGRASRATPGSISSRMTKRKRQGTPPEPPAPPTQVLWTRGFTKVSSSALEQISSHRDANMFATGVRERDAPNYRQIVLQPQDITSIRAAIKQGNKAAVQAAANLPDGDPSTANVYLPISEDLVPPRGIVNSAQLERELIHMFCNAIMYNPDPDRGLGSSFLNRSADEEEGVVGYHVDENGVVKNTRAMFVEVEKLLGDLRSAEKDRGVPPANAPHQASVPTASRHASGATPADDTAEDEDELAGDGGTAAASVAKRRRVASRG